MNDVKLSVERNRVYRNLWRAKRKLSLFKARAALGLDPRTGLRTTEMLTLAETEVSIFDAELAMRHCIAHNDPDIEDDVDDAFEGNLRAIIHAMTQEAASDEFREAMGKYLEESQNLRHEWQEYRANHPALKGKTEDSTA